MTTWGVNDEARVPLDVSVVIPVYNPGPLLAQQLDALRSQDFGGSWEVVIADNGTTDGSLDALGGIRDVPVRVVDARSRRGPSHARNVGAQAARGRWLAFCDADDVAAPEWLSRLFDARATGDVIAGVYDIARLNAPELSSLRGTSDYWKGLPKGPCGFLPFANTGNMMIRRDAFVSMCGFDESLSHCEDVEFSWRAQLAGLSLALAPEAVIGYRFRATALDTFRQMKQYTLAETQLYLRYRDAGARRQSPSQVLARAFWVVSRSPYAVLDTKRRFLWFSVAGTLVGRVRGSLRYRVVYL